MAKPYEIVVVYHETAGTEAEEAVKSIITTAGGTIRDEQVMGMKNLAYPIAKQKSGRFVFYLLELEPNVVADIDRDVRRASGVLRHLLLQELRFSERQLQMANEKEDSETSGKPKMAALPPSVATSSKATPKPAVEPGEETEPLNEEERQKRLDEKLEEILKD